MTSSVIGFAWCYTNVNKQLHLLFSILMTNANSISHLLLLVRLYFLKLANLESREETRMPKGTVENCHCTSAAFSEIQRSTSIIWSKEDCVKGLRSIFAASQ